MTAMSARSSAVFGGIATLLVAAGLLLGGRLTPRVERLGQQVKTLTTEPESIADGAVYQRYRAQRDALVDMQAMLARLVPAESAYAAQFGHPTSNPTPPYWTNPPSRTTVGPFILISFRGWMAWSTDNRTTMWCAVAVGPDTARVGNAPSGKPVCFGARSFPEPERWQRESMEEYRHWLRDSTPVEETTRAQ
jgi:hypothetical protein